MPLSSLRQSPAFHSISPTLFPLKAQPPRRRTCQVSFLGRTMPTSTLTGFINQASFLRRKSFVCMIVGVFYPPPSTVLTVCYPTGFRKHLKDNDIRPGTLVCKLEVAKRGVSQHNAGRRVSNGRAAAVCFICMSDFTRPAALDGGYSMLYDCAATIHTLQLRAPSVSC
jgi:hypothetical protein